MFFTKMISMVLTIALLASGVALAQEDYCEPLERQFGDIPGGIFNEDIPQERLNIVSPSLRVTLREGWARNFYYKDEFGETYFEIFEDGETSGFGRVEPQHLDGDLCAKPNDLNIIPKWPFGGDVIFSIPANEDGHTVKDLTQGAKDMRWRLVNLVPVGKFFASRVIRRNRYLHIIPLGEDGQYLAPTLPAPELVFRTVKEGAEPEPVEVLRLGRTYAIKIKNLNRSGADKLYITGGDYEIAALPNLRSLLRYLNKNTPAADANSPAVEAFETIISTLEEDADTLEPRTDLENPVSDIAIDVRESFPR